MRRRESKLSTRILNQKSFQEISKKETFVLYAWVISFILLFSILFFYVGTGTVFGNDELGIQSELLDISAQNIAISTKQENKL